MVAMHIHVAWNQRWSLYMHTKHCFLIFQTQKWIASPWPIAVSSYEELLSFIPWHRNLDFELHRQALCMIIIVNIIIILSFTINTLCGQAAHRSAAFRIAPWCCSSSYCHMKSCHLFSCIGQKLWHWRRTLNGRLPFKLRSDRQHFSFSVSFSLVLVLVLV